MFIKINGKTLSIPSPINIQEIKKQFDPEADVVIYNGFPIDNEDILLKENDELYFIKKKRIPKEEELEYLIISRHTPQIAEKLKQATIGIAGLGGLGSHIAIALSRIGIGHLVLVDFDIVEPSNLNRQHYFIEHLGLPKTEAMAAILKKINPYHKITIYNQRITEENVHLFFHEYTLCDLVIEAFDNPESKAMLIRECLKINKTIIAASGVAGYGENDSIITRKINDHFYIVGDFTNEAMPGRGLMAPRVMIAAAKQANLAVEIILNRKKANYQ